LTAAIFFAFAAPTVTVGTSTATAGVSFNPAPLAHDHAPVSSAGYVALAHTLAPAIASSPARSALSSDSASAGPTNIPVNALRFTNDRSYVAQTETSVAVDPANTSRVVGGFNDFRGFFCPTSPFNPSRCPSGAVGSLSGFSVSANGGVSLAQSGDIPGVLARLHDPYTRASYNGLLMSFGDPNVAPAPGNNFYYASLAVGNNTSANGIELAISNARLWGPNACSTPAAQPWTNPCWTSKLVFANLSDVAGTFEDKDSIAVDRNPGSPYFGDVYVAWDHFDANGDSHTFLARCTPALSCRMLSGGLAPVVSGPDRYVAWSTPAVGSNDVVHVSWCDLGSYTSFAPDFCRVASSPAGGPTFGANSTILSYGAAGTELPLDTYVTAFSTEQFRTASISSFAADTSSRSSNLYFTLDLCTLGHYYNFQQARSTYAGLGVCSASSVLFTKSSNGGHSWSTPTILSVPGVNTQPWVTVDASNGAVTVDWLTSQYDPAEHRLDVVTAVSANAGASFVDQRVTTVSNEPNDDPLWVMGFAPQIGDYQQAADANGRMWILFTGNYDVEQGTFQADPFLTTWSD
jgi:hypothetical protein